jgi:hypothetical protein
MRTAVRGFPATFRQPGSAVPSGFPKNFTGDRTMAVLLDYWPFGAVFAALAGFLLLALWRRPAPPPPGFDRRGALVDETGRMLFHALRRAVGDRQHVLAKVPLKELVTPLEPERHSDADRHRVDTEHVDFVLCHPKSLRPLLVVQRYETDDAENDSAEEPPATEPKKENFVFETLESAGVPWLAVCTDAVVEVRRLRRQIRECLT